MSRIGTLKSEELKMRQDVVATEIKKEIFITQIKNGLGDEILKEPNKERKRLSFWQKIKKMFSYE
jgi:hypothetical protein